MLQRTVDVGVAQYFAPYRHPVLIALFIIHGVPPGKQLSSAEVKLFGASMLDRCDAARTTTSEAGICCCRK